MVRLVALVALFAGFCWFGTQVPLGSHTLFGHLHAIAGTRESQDLFDGTRESAKPLVDNVRRRIAGAPDSTPSTAPASRMHDAHPDAGAALHAAEPASGHIDDPRSEPHNEARKAPRGKQPREELTPSERNH